MRINAIPIGFNPPEDINVIVEVAIGGEPIKYEMDKEAVRWWWIVFFTRRCITPATTVLFRIRFPTMATRSTYSSPIPVRSFRSYHQCTSCWRPENG